MNMRKIIAVLAAALMLCAAIPFSIASVSAAADNLFPNGDFETGAASGWDLGWMGTNVKAEAAHTGSYGLRVNTNGSWNGCGNVVVEGLTVGKTYTFSLWYKSDGVAWINTTLKGNNDGAAQIGTMYLRSDVTEWTQLEETFVATDSAVKLNFAGGGSSGAADATKAGVVYVDDIELICLSSDMENLFPNGDFATTDKNGWNYSWYGTKISADAAYEGAYGLELITNGTWNAAGYITVSGLEIGTTYKFSFMGKAASAPMNYGAYNANGTKDNKIIAGSVNKGGDWVKYSGTFTAVTDSLYLMFNGYGTGTANEAYAGSFYVDNIMLTKSLPNLFPNGDFGVSEKGSWDFGWMGTKISADAAYEGDYGLLVKTDGSWNGSGNITFDALTTGQKYEFTVMCKRAEGDGGINIYLYDTNKNGTKYFGKYVSNTTEWTELKSTFVATSPTVYLNLPGPGSSGSADATKAATVYFDEFTITPYCEKYGHSYVEGICSDCGAADPDYEPPHVCDVVEQERVEADCTNDGYIKYACDCGLGEYTETIPAKGHTPGAAADCDSAQFCEICGAELAPALGHTPGAAADCDSAQVCEICGIELAPALGHTPGAAADCDSAQVCEICGIELAPATGAHTYDNDYDVDCNVCGTIREVELPVASAGTSASEDVSGVAALFNVEVDGLAIKEGTATEADLTNATVNGYKLISMGAIATNGSSSVDIPVVYLYELSEEATAYAIRVKNIPADKYDVEITFTPYVVIEIDGVETTIYGDTQINSYNGVLAG